MNLRNNVIWGKKPQGNVKRIRFCKAISKTIFKGYIYKWKGYIYIYMYILQVVNKQKIKDSGDL